MSVCVIGIDNHPHANMLRSGVRFIHDHFHTKRLVTAVFLQVERIDDEDEHLFGQCYDGRLIHVALQEDPWATLYIFCHEWGHVLFPNEDDDNVVDEWACRAAGVLKAWANNGMPEWGNTLLSRFKQYVNTGDDSLLPGGE